MVPTRNNSDGCIFFGVCEPDAPDPILPPSISEEPRKPSLGVFPLDKTNRLPIFATAQSACFDLTAWMPESSTVKIYLWAEKTERVVSDGKFVLNPGETALVPTGLILDIPVGYSVRLHNRSGLALKSAISLANHVGIIDSDYVEPVFMILKNQGKVPHTIHHMERCAQGEMIKSLNYEVRRMDKRPDRKTLRSGGFGSTGSQ